MSTFIKVAKVYDTTYTSCFSFISNSLSMYCSENTCRRSSSYDAPVQLCADDAVPINCSCCAKYDLAAIQKSAILLYHASIHTYIVTISIQCDLYM
ncbi:hypothetical protein BDB00DRAFT_856113, partial [Zychaea mexicana]|uniref:uncharacterized protein n=1 Tax=Zychaea mexicana TaxID=64656 RepID=UPI0022FF0203